MKDFRAGDTVTLNGKLFEWESTASPQEKILASFISEDTLINYSDHPDNQLFGVFDGHGGDKYSTLPQ